MRTSVVAFVSLLALVACAEEHLAPPPPARPVIEGDRQNVSAADIRACIAAVKRDFSELHLDYPIYRVHVLDRDHIDVCYWPLRNLEECRHLERHKGKWNLTQVAIDRGSALRD